MQNRRTWLKSAIALAGSLPLTNVLAEDLYRSSVSRAESEFTPFNTGKIIRLGSNENPHGPSPKALEAIKNILSEGNRYTFDVAHEFKTILAEKEGVSPDHILLGNGSGELLCMAGLNVGLEGGRVISAFPTFRLLMDYAERFGATWDKVNVDEELKMNLEAMARAIKPETKLMVIVNPNNPTGTLLDGQKVKAFGDEVSRHVPVYSDEAYLEFLEPAQQVSLVELVKQGRDVIVSRTFSKIYGLAGLRLGYIVAQPDRIRSMARCHMSSGLNLNQVGIAAARVAIKDFDFQYQTRKKNAEARKVLTTYLDRKKIFYGQSHTNFLFFPAPIDGKTLLQKTMEKGFEIRVWDYNNREWCRVSIGTADEMRSFVRAFDTIIAS